MEDKWFWIFMVTAFITFAVGTAYENYNKSEITKACYEAAKVNQNLRCDK